MNCTDSQVVELRAHHAKPIVRDVSRFRSPRFLSADVSLNVISMFVKAPTIQGLNSKVVCFEVKKNNNFSSFLRENKTKISPQAL